VASGINTLVDCLGCAVFIHSRHRRRASIKSERAQSAYDGHSLSFFVTSLTGDLAVAGAAINELIDGIPRADNPGMGGDMQGAAEIFKAMGFDQPQDMQMLWDIGVERVVQRINAIPGLADLIREEAGR